MIDCGLLQGTKRGKEIMLQVVEDIEATLNANKPADAKHDSMLWYSLMSTPITFQVLLKRGMFLKESNLERYGPPGWMMKVIRNTTLCATAFTNK